MTNLQTEAFVLRRLDHGEDHVIVHLLGRETGRISAMAFGARRSKRRFAGALEPLRVVEAHLKAPRSGDLYTLEELEVLESFPGLEERIETITAASYGTELVRETWSEGVASEQIFELLRHFYIHLPRCRSAGELWRLTYQLELELLSLYGLLPMIHHCARCGLAPEAMDRLRFSRRGEGLICQKCRHPGDMLGTVEPATLKLLHHLDNPDLPMPLEAEKALPQAGRILENALDQLLTRPLVSRTMLQQLI